MNHFKCLLVFFFLTAFYYSEAQNCKVAMISSAEVTAVGHDTCCFIWPDENEQEIIIPASVIEIIYSEIQMKEAGDWIKFQDPLKIIRIKYFLGEYYEEGDIKPGNMVGFRNLKNVDINIPYFSPHDFLQLKKSFPHIHFFVQDRDDLNRQYKGIAMSEYMNGEIPADTFYLIGYNWDGQESWNAIYELNRNTIERLIISPEWEDQYNFRFAEFPNLRTIVLLNYGRAEQIQSLIKRMLRNRNVKEIILRDCDVTEEALQNLKKKSKKLKITIEKSNSGYY